MKSSMISGLIALQLAATVTVQAQNYYIKINGDLNTRIADHLSWSREGDANLDPSLEAYNLDLNNNNKAIGTMFFQSATGNISYATHYRLNSTSEQVIARKLLKPTEDHFYVIGEKVKSGAVTSAAVLRYSRGDGSLIKAWELSMLPLDYKFLHVFDVTTELGTPNQIRILSTVYKGNTQGIMELLFNVASGQYKVVHYKPKTLAPEKCNSAYYVHSDHYGMFNLGKVSFYGMGIAKDQKAIAFCYADNIYEQYRLVSPGGIQEVAGVQMNGSYGANGLQHEIDMAFIDAEGNICLQQKDFMTSLHWRKAYYLTGGKFRMSMGRNGHGTKAGYGMNYFIATALHPDFSDHEGRITTLHYNTLNGNLDQTNIWNMSGIGVNGEAGFPNNAFDPGANYTFIADRHNQKNGFKLGTGNASATGTMPCTQLKEFKEAPHSLYEYKDELNVTTYDSYNASLLDMVRVGDIRVEAIPECSTEQRGLAEEEVQSKLPVTGNLQMNKEQLRIEATSKTIISLRLLSIDGRLVLEKQNINSNTYRQQFARPLVPGIYIVHISYSDHSTEARKVSVR